MFRRDAYERAGGYRAAFYYGQDYDLWYRLAELGKFLYIDEVLYTARITPDSITGAARERQLAIGELSREALAARQRGEPDTEVLARAAAITRAPSARGCAIFSRWYSNLSSSAPLPKTQYAREQI